MTMEKRNVIARDRTPAYAEQDAQDIIEKRAATLFDREELDIERSDAKYKRDGGTERLR